MGFGNESLDFAAGVEFTKLGLYPELSGLAPKKLGLLFTVGCW